VRQDQAQKCAVVEAVFQVTQAVMPKKQSLWHKDVSFVEWLDKPAVMQMIYVSEAVQNQLKCVGLVTVDQMVVFVLKVVWVADHTAQQEMHCIVVL
jgi:hypothetical protein